MLKLFIILNHDLGMKIHRVLLVKMQGCVGGDDVIESFIVDGWKGREGRRGHIEDIEAGYIMKTILASL